MPEHAKRGQYFPLTIWFGEKTAGIIIGAINGSYC